MNSALLFGLLQGISAFFPISSDGHLALAAMLFDLKNADLTLTVLLHTGTLLAIVFVMREKLGAAIYDGVRALFAPALFRTSPGGQDALFVILASIPTAMIGLTMSSQLGAWRGSPLVVGLGFLATSALLASTRFPRQGVIEHPGLRAALILGAVQGLAIFPGLSRLGITIAVALFLGITRSRAFELSLLMSIPAVLGEMLFQLSRLVGEPNLVGELSGVPADLSGGIVACGSGILAMLATRRILLAGMFPLFALWVFPIAIATLFMARAWPK